MEYPVAKLSFSAFARLHGVSPKTLDRWIERGVLPAPTYISGRKYFDVDVVPQRSGPQRPRGIATTSAEGGAAD